MTAELDFLQDIAEHPDDPACRLVYADWLSDRGDPRGDFIRVQCALAKPSHSEVERQDLQQQERDLLRTYRCRWLGPLARREIKVEFVGGFPCGLRLAPAQFVRIARHLPRYAPALQTLQLRLNARDRSGSAYGAIDRLTRMQCAPNLQRLIVASCAVGVPDVGKLVKSPYLTRLQAIDLSWNHVGDAALEWLSLNGGLPALRQLDVSFTGFGKHGMRILTESEKLKSLHLLVIHDPQIRRRGFQYSIRHLQDTYGQRLLIV